MENKNGVSSFKKYMVLEIIILFAVLALDIFFKKYSEANLQNNSIVLIPGIINLVYVENTGAAFGMLKGHLQLFIILTVLALAVFIFFLYKKRFDHYLLKISLAFIIAGTVGNFIDRVKVGYVVDMLEFQFVDFAVFNIADSSLTVGVTLFAIYYLFIYKEPDKKNINGNDCSSLQDIEQNTQNTDNKND